MHKFNLRKKFGLITGAGGLLGYEHACALLEVGADVVLTDVNIKNLNKNYKSLKKIFKNKLIIKKFLDVTNEQSVKNCKKFLDKKGIFIDILVNNAAYNPGSEELNSSLFENYKLKKWKKEIDVGLTGAFICSKIFGSEMAKRKKGIILNISSDLSVISPDQRLYNRGKKLKNVNLRLWNVEDKLRIFEKKKLFKKDFINYARKVYYMNDKRSYLKNEINKRTNSHISEVKSYEKY